VARIFRFLVKKRGARRTGSRLVGTVGEAMFFGVLFFLGSASLAALITDQFLNPNPQILAPGFGFWVLVLVLATFVLVGGGGVVYTVLHVGASAERRSALVKRAANLDLIGNGSRPRVEYPGIPNSENLTNSPGVLLSFRLPISQSPGGRLLATMIVFLLLTGVTTVLGVIALQEHRTQRPDWFLTGFVGILVALDAWVTGLFLRQIWRQTRLGPTCVEVSHHPLRPGVQYAIFLSQYGRVSLDSLRMSLVCEEEATYRQGTDVRTESQAVHEQLIFSRGGIRIDPATPFELQEVVSVPRQAMHSFQSGHNAVRWKLVVKAESENWPMFVRSFPVLVYPASNGSPSPHPEQAGFAAPRHD
jgi:hypothetical protein